MQILNCDEQIPRTPNIRRITACPFCSNKAWGEFWACDISCMCVVGCVGGWMVHWLILVDWLISWLVDWSVGRFAVCLLAWLIEWLLSCLVACLLAWFIDWSFVWRVGCDWLVGGLIDWLIDWLRQGWIYMWVHGISVLICSFLWLCFLFVCFFLCSLFIYWLIDRLTFCFHSLTCSLWQSYLCEDFYLFNLLWRGGEPSFGWITWR